MEPFGLNNPNNNVPVEADVVDVQIRVRAEAVTGPEVRNMSLTDAEENGFAKRKNPAKKERIPCLNSIKLFRYCKLIVLFFVLFFTAGFSRFLLFLLTSGSSVLFCHKLFQCSR